MSRFQISLNVADVEAAVGFYSKLFGVDPAKQRAGYANFVMDDPSLKLVVIEGEGEPGTINHVGVEHADGAAVAAETSRVAAAGLPVEVDDPHTCCFATQEKAWTIDPDGVPWEIYAVTADTEHFGASSRGGTPVDHVLPPMSRDEMRSAVADPDWVVIDAQGDDGFDRAHIDGALDFPLVDAAELATHVIPALDSNVVVYCTDLRCLGSEFVGTQLVEAGYTNVRRFPGGIAEWRDAGLPVITGDDVGSSSADAAVDR